MSNKLLFPDSVSSSVSERLAVESKRPNYPCRPILTIEALGKALEISPSILIEVAEKASSEYRQAGKKRKSDGSIRILWDARGLLKHIQSRIKERLLDRVVFPEYLFGGIRGRSNFLNARFHSGAKILIAEDIASYFPSITARHVYSIWRNVFGCSKQVTRLLTKLTTRDDELPQGAKTSPHLSNIALWRIEPSLVQRVNRLGMRYSRFVDDIRISSRRKHPPLVIKKVIRQVYGALYSAGFSPNLEKHDFSWRGRPMLVTKLNIDNKISLPAHRRTKLKQDTRQLAKYADYENYSASAIKLARSLATRAGTTKKFHPLLARRVQSVIQVFDMRKRSNNNQRAQ